MEFLGNKFTPALLVDFKITVICLGSKKSFKEDCNIFFEFDVLSNVKQSKYSGLILLIVIF